MTPDHPTSPVERLATEVRDYATKAFRLRDDIDHLHGVYHAGAPEATVFYSARILEFLSAQSLKVVQLSPSSDVFGNLDTLQQYNLLQGPTLSWAHALRRLGNAARHIHRRLRPDEAELAVLFTERCLEWFFLCFPYRPHPDLGRLTCDEGPFTLTSGAELRQLLVKLDKGDLGSCEAGTCGPVFLRAAALPAVAAEIMLDRGRHDAARDLLEVALKETPDDLRLNQLMVLHASRTGNLPEARRRLRLKPLCDRLKDDSETMGIAAGVYKRLWLSERANTSWLNESHRAYRKGWEDPRLANAYLGINTATTALWLGRREDARRIAADVCKLLERRAAGLRKRHPDDPGLALNYWDRATLAEAQVLLGDFAAARRTYREAFDQYPEQTANISVSRKQLEEILRVLGPPFTADEFLAGPGGGAA